MSQNEWNAWDSKTVDQWIEDTVDSNHTSAMVLQQDTAADTIFAQAKGFMGMLVNYKEMMMMYTCAMKEIRTKFDVLNTEFNVRYQRNPISSISTRLKRTYSIAEKLEKKNLKFSTENIENNIFDMAGVRVICSYIDDIYKIADAFLAQDDITLINRKDYIANPKENGYRSLHLIVSVPVFFAEQKKNVKVEVQIRTIAMDFWASLEHQLKYKQELPDKDGGEMQKEIVLQLKECADVIAETDKQMLEIRNKIENMSDAPTEDDILFEKLTRLDVSLN